MNDIIAFTEQLTGRRLHDKECLAYIIKLVAKKATTVETRVKTERGKR